MQSLVRCACCATAVRALVVHGACVASGLVPPPLLALLHKARVAAAREPYGESQIPAEFKAHVRRALLGAPWRAALAQYLAATPFASAHPSARIALSSVSFAPCHSPRCMSRTDGIATRASCACSCRSRACARALARRGWLPLQRFRRPPPHTHTVVS